MEKLIFFVFHVAVSPSCNKVWNQSLTAGSTSTVIRMLFPSRMRLTNLPSNFVLDVVLNETCWCRALTIFVVTTIIRSSAQSCRWRHAVCDRVPCWRLWQNWILWWGDELIWRQKIGVRKWNDSKELILMVLCFAKDWALFIDGKTGFIVAYGFIIHLVTSDFTRS